MMTIHEALPVPAAGTAQGPIDWHPRFAALVEAIEDQRTAG